MTNKTSSDNKMCLNCSYVLFSDSSRSGYRCGREYFLIPPLERRVVRMDSYYEVTPDDRCTEWKPQGGALGTDI